MEKLPVDSLSEIASDIPIEALIDIKNRMGDWVLSGGKQNDPYMWQQVRYAERFLKLKV
ncbi:DUF6877 family protein [Companilactobacillus keshanensis]|uniref:DUF6877 family protein n=1 Tax=Companilactobacillus keshanensis TaxID=2486003 RepID=A0ABW4BU42_9LACO|nr:DUF6877 family protein [Companilactobacillus keshanensis]